MLSRDRLIPALFVLLWSTGFIGARYAMPHAEPFTFLSMRYALALAILVPAALLARLAWPGPRQAGHAMVAGLLIHGIYLGGVFYAMRHGLDAGIAALIVGLQPVLTTVFAVAFLGEAMGPRHVLGLALGLLGVGLVVAPRVGEGASLHWAMLFPVFLSALAISAGTIWQKRFASGLDLRLGTALQYCGALAPTALAALLLETGRVSFNGELVFALLWLVLVLSIGAVFLMLRLIREGAVSSVASLMYLTPGVTAVMAFLLFGEALAPVQVLGLCLAGIGVAAATRPRADPDPPVRA